MESTHFKFTPPPPAKTRLDTWKLIERDSAYAAEFCKCLKQAVLSISESAEAAPPQSKKAKPSRVLENGPRECTGVFLEFPLLSSETADKAAFFVVTPSNRFYRPGTADGDPAAFADKFEEDKSPTRVIAFDSMNGDGRLVAPRPEAADEKGADPTKFSRHLMDFVLNAPADLQSEFMGRVAAEVLDRFEKEPRVYVSTSGMAVPWLHMRIFPAPKYYVWPDHDKK